MLVGSGRRGISYIRRGGRWKEEHGEYDTLLQTLHVGFQSNLARSVDGSNDLGI